MKPSFNWGGLRAQSIFSKRVLRQDAVDAPVMNGEPRILHSSMHLPALDGLRGVAIALVLMHSLTMVQESHSVPAYLLKFVFTFGWVGVQLFLVLSGFLITGILLDTRRSTNYFKSFFGRRLLRIFPLYYGTLIIAFILLPAIGAMPELYERDAVHQIRFWLYLTNWYSDNGGGFSHYWSLALEEQFYLLWPLVVYRCSSKSLLKICFGIAFASFAFRMGMRWEDVSSDFVYISSFCRMDALAMGAAVAVIMRDPDWIDRLRNRVTLIVGFSIAVGLVTVLLTGSYGSSFLGQTVGYGTLAISFSLAVLAAALADYQQLTVGWRTVLTSKSLRTLGKYSYGMYVFQRQLHKLVGEPLMHKLPVSVAHAPVVDFLYVLVMSLLTLGVAMLSYHFFEMPFLRLKGRFVAAHTLSNSAI